MKSKTRMKLRKVICCLVASCQLWLGAGVAYSKEELPAFSDIKGSFAEKSIKRLTKQGIIRGISPNEFAPRQDVSRLQFAILIAKGLGVQPLYPETPSFSDVASGTIEAGYVEALVNLGLLKGIEENSFAPERPIRRQDVAVIITKAMKEQNQAPSYEGTKYTDSSQIYPYAVDSVGFVTEKGWMKGNKGYFYPLHNLTRAEAAVIIDRLYETRKDQAANAMQQPPELVEIGTGKSKKVAPSMIQNNLPFTPVYGTDNSEVFSVTSEGVLSTGKQSGTGLLTVNTGTLSYPSEIRVNAEPTKGTVKVKRTKPSGSDESLTPQYTEDELTVTTAVYEHSPDTAFKNTERKAYPGPVEGISSKGDTWTGFLRQQGRDIVIDLGQLGTISGVSLEFKQDAGAGVYLPEYLKGSVSVDGVSWYQLGKVYHGIEPTDLKSQNVSLSLTFPSMNARYLKISFPVDIWVFARNLTVTGGAPVEKPIILAPDSDNTGLGEEYLQDPDIKDILLVYTGNKSYQQTLTSEDFLPLAAYLTRQGEIKGSMFDTMLFLPTKLPCTRVGWNSYLDDLFADGQQLHALEDAMEKINTATGQQKKEKVILTIPYPDSKQDQFDQSTSFTDKLIGREQAAQNRLAAAEWYYNEMMTRWNSAGFQNLDLIGIYWYAETIDHSVYQEKALVQKVAHMVSSNGQKFFWIPYYGAQGYKDWKSYGFTHVFLQPNYYSSQSPPEDRMDQAATLARQYETGIEIELDNRVLYEPFYYNLFYKELKKGHQLGLDGNTVNAYHVGIKGTVLDTVYSDYPDIRGIYDDLYRWISGSYN